VVPVEGARNAIVILVLELAIVEPVVAVRDPVAIPVLRLLSIAVTIVRVGNAVTVFIAPRLRAIAVVG
jgi:hypothetical protein